MLTLLSEKYLINTINEMLHLNIIQNVSIQVAHILHICNIIHINDVLPRLVTLRQNNLKYHICYSLQFITNILWQSITKPSLCLSQEFMNEFNEIKLCF